MSNRLTSTLNNLKSSVSNSLSSRFCVRSLSETQTALDSWLKTPLGQRLMAQESYHVDQLSRCIFGYHLMQLSISSECDLFGNSSINHRFHFSPQKPINKPCLDGAIAQFEQLPLASESIDVGILHHVLNYSPNPYQTLREASRVIIPHGHLLIVGFNPWSLLGICKPIARVIFNSPQWCHHSISLGRIINWLSLLDFELVCKRYDYYGLPSDDGYCPRIDTVGRKLFPICGAFYIVLARKQVLRMTPIKPAQQKFKTLPQWGKASPMPRKQG